MYYKLVNSTNNVAVTSYMYMYGCVHSRACACMGECVCVHVIVTRHLYECDIVLLK